ncbi:MAG: GFA family protein [Hyphomonadaceae bacterium]
MTAITGGCLCKTVRFTATAAPIAVRQCWCRDCQYWASGSATVNAVFDASAVTIEGKLSTFISRADSGNTMTRGFCSTCGTPVTSASHARPHLVILRVGTFDDPAIAKPAMNIWTSSAPHWAHLDPEIPSTPHQPPAPQTPTR